MLGKRLKGAVKDCHLLSSSGKLVSPFRESQVYSACAEIPPVLSYTFADCDGDRRYIFALLVVVGESLLRDPCIIDHLFESYHIFQEPLISSKWDFDCRQ